MLSFYPGTSKTHPLLSEFFAEALQKNICSLPHRSEEFSEIYRACRQLFLQKLFMPEDFYLFFVSSATEVWDIINRTYQKDESLHIYSGDFGEKWFLRHQIIAPENTIGQYFHHEDEAVLPDDIEKFSLICLTHCETSNGTLISDKFLRELREKNPHAHIALDATSTAGGLRVDWQNIDFYFASVQKCLALPAGLAIFCVRKKIIKAQKTAFNAPSILAENAEKFQTHCTPNVLNIFLLQKSLENSFPIPQTEKILRERGERFLAELQTTNLKTLVRRKSLISPTVFCFFCEKIEREKLFRAAKTNNILLGNGYGRWAENTFRIANFPQHTNEDFEKLTTFLRTQF
jgi:phosphoserine aminotransferase